MIELAINPCIGIAIVIVIAWLILIYAPIVCSSQQSRMEEKRQGQAAKGEG